MFTYPQPIMLVGTDLLAFSPVCNCTFAYLGVNPLSATGEIVFFDKMKQKFMACELVSSPTTHSAIPENAKKVRFEDDLKELK